MREPAIRSHHIRLKTPVSHRRKCTCDVTDILSATEPTTWDLSLEMQVHNGWGAKVGSGGCMIASACRFARCGWGEAACRLRQPHTDKHPLQAFSIHHQAHQAFSSCPLGPCHHIDVYDDPRLHATVLLPSFGVDTAPRKLDGAGHVLCHIDIVIAGSCRLTYIGPIGMRSTKHARIKAPIASMVAVQS